MVTVFIGIGFLLVLFGIIGIYVKRYLYKNGIRTIGTVVGVESYTYVTQGPESNTLYHPNVTPIIEVKDDDRVIRVMCSGENDYYNLEKGDEIELIYHKGKIENFEIYNTHGIYNFYVAIISFGILISLVGIMFMVI
ncbi:hypothetical protein JCM1393_23940 [Clostridium carnis]